MTVFKKQFDKYIKMLNELFINIHLFLNFFVKNNNKNNFRK